jgi:hypothetical protein
MRNMAQNTDATDQQDLVLMSNAILAEPYWYVDRGEGDRNKAPTKTSQEKKKKKGQHIILLNFF